MPSVPGLALRHAVAVRRHPDPGVSMPSISGWALQQWIRSGPGYAGIRFYALGIGLGFVTTRYPGAVGVELCDPKFLCPQFRAVFCYDACNTTTPTVY